jgi:ubiquinone/menaquinone biosynthesis C-methylase UbiE
VLTRDFQTNRQAIAAGAVVMTRALAGHGPIDAAEWDDDRTVVVATIGAAPSPCGLTPVFLVIVRDYDLIADWYRSDRSRAIGVREALAAVASLPRGSRILDMGCGNGWPITDALVTAGYHVVGLDSSQGMLERFRVNLPNTPTVRGDSRACPFMDGVFDAAVSWGMLFHLEPRDQATAFAGVSRVLTPGAPFLFTAAEIPEVKADDPGITGTMNGVTFRYYAVASYRALIAEHGFALEDVYDDRGVSTYYFARKTR